MCRLCTSHLELVREGEMNRPKHETEATKQAPPTQQTAKTAKTPPKQGTVLSQDGRVSQKSGETEYGLGQ